MNKKYLELLNENEKDLSRLQSKIEHDKCTGRFGNTLRLTEYIKELGLAVRKINTVLHLTLSELDKLKKKKNA